MLQQDLEWRMGGGTFDDNGDEVDPAPEVPPPVDPMKEFLLWHSEFDLALQALLELSDAPPQKTPTLHFIDGNQDQGPN